MQRQLQASSNGATWGWGIVGGALGVFVQQNIGGFAFGAVIGVLFAQVLHLRDRAQSLQQQIDWLKRSLSEREPIATARSDGAETSQPAAAAPPAPTAAPVPPAKTIPAATPRAWHLDVEGEQPDVARPRRTSAPPSAPTAFDRTIEYVVAWLKRGNPLARIGLVILFFGAAFLAKYAAENSFFPIELRFIAIASGALGLLIFGWHLRTRRPVYAQLLQGGGVAGLYLTVFAATRLYELLPLGLAFGLMVVIALASAVLAVAQNSLSLAVIGTAGGFLAPILVSTGSGNHVALFAYYTLLNLGVFAIAWFKVWRVLNVVGFVFTFAITGLWRVSGYEAEDRWSADAFLVLFFAMYLGVSILNCVREPANLRGYLSGSLVFGLPVVAFTLHATLVAPVEHALAWSAFGLGALYLLLGWALLRTGRENFRLQVEAFAALGIIFASLAIPLAFDTRTTAAMWAVEGAGLLWLGVRQQRKLARAFGVLLQVGAGIGYLIGLDELHGAMPVANSAYLGALMLGMSGVFSGYWLHRHEAQRASYESGAATALLVWGLAWWMFAGLHEIHRFLAAAQLGAALIYVSVSAALLAILGLRSAWSTARTIALFLAPLAGVIAFAHAVVLGHPFAQWGALGWAALLTAHVALLRMHEGQQLPELSWLHAVGYSGLALLLAWQISWQVDRHTAGVWASLPWGLIPTLMIAWLGRRDLTPRWPLAAHETSYRVFAALPLAVALCAWIAAINLTSSGDPVWLPYVPLLNPLDVATALAFAALALWWSSLNEQQRASVWSFDMRGLIALATGLMFLWLNAALIRALHHNFAAPLTAYGIAHSTLVQASLSIFWGVLGFIAMALAARRGWRYVWIVGGGLMAVVVAKLFLVDLSSIGTIARITSFLTVGALLLITGYLAPLPPRRTAR